MRAEVRAALGLVEALVQRPDEVAPEDIAPLREARVPDEDIENVIAVCSLFSMIVRLADSLGFEVPPAEAFEKNAGFLLKRGYA